MTRTTAFGCAAVLVFFVLGCEGSIQPSEDPNIGVDREEFFSGVIRGHEDLTRFSIEKANAVIKSELGVSNFYPTVSILDSCLYTSHKILKGNCATDYPDDAMTAYYGHPADGFGDAPDLQDLHFLRNHTSSSTVVSAREACEDSKARIVNAALLAAAYWKNGNSTSAYYWMGHVLHTIQDSFAPAHTARTGTLYRTLTDVCTWNIQVPGVCYHATLDSGDTVWRSSLTCPGLTRPWSCLTAQAQSAVYASVGFLRVMARYARAGFQGDLEAMLVQMLEGAATDSYVGYFHCEQLP